MSYGDGRYARGFEANRRFSQPAIMQQTLEDHRRGAPFAQPRSFDRRASATNRGDDSPPRRPFDGGVDALRREWGLPAHGADQFGNDQDYAGGRYARGFDAGGGGGHRRQSDLGPQFRRDFAS